MHSYLAGNSVEKISRTIIDSNAIIFGSSFIVEFDVFLAAGFEKACLSGKVRV